MSQGKGIDDRWKKLRQKFLQESLAKGIKPKSVYQMEMERGQLKTFDELRPDIQRFLKGEAPDMLIASWTGKSAI